MLWRAGQASMLAALADLIVERVVAALLACNAHGGRRRLAHRASDPAMTSNKPPSPEGPRLDQGQSHPPEQKPVVQEDTLTSATIPLEPKAFTFTLKQNQRGRFLRITEEAGGKRNTVTIPVSDLDHFQRVLDAMVAAALTRPQPIQAEEPDDSIGNR